MARNTMEAWIPEEYDSQVSLRVRQTSAVESFARVEPMASDTKHVPRTFGAGIDIIAKGGTYNEDQTVNGEVLLIATKAGRVFRIAEEDLADAAVDAISAKQQEFASSFGIWMDNSSLAVTAAQNGGTVPFESVYRAVRTAGAAGTLPDNGSYVADANYDSVSNASLSGTAAGVGYAAWKKLSGVLAKVEDSPFFDPNAMQWILAPKWRQILRELKNDNGTLLLQNATTDGAQDRLAGIPVKWSMGAKTSATATSAPTGNSLAIIANMNYAVLGKRSGPESVVIDGRNGASALTDETLLKCRARRGFAVATPAAFGVVELLP